MSNLSGRALQRGRLGDGPKLAFGWQLSNPGCPAVDPSTGKTAKGARMSEDVSRVAAVERALSILEAFDASGPKLSLAELHRKTRIAKPTLLRLMQSLLDHGLLMPVDSSTYCVGAATLRLAGLHTAVGRMDNELIAILNEL
jgi:hypothetical protein